ncbi:hypothetical protein H5T87_08220 [bacterium]|nr:hypothetical protein [bacterium]
MPGPLPPGPIIFIPGFIGILPPATLGLWAAHQYTATMIAKTIMMTITATAGLTCFPPVDT